MNSSFSYKYEVWEYPSIGYSQDRPKSVIYENRGDEALATDRQCRAQELPWSMYDLNNYSLPFQHRGETENYIANPYGEHIKVRPREGGIYILSSLDDKANYDISHDEALNLAPYDNGEMKIGFTCICRLKRWIFLNRS